MFLNTFDKIPWGALKYMAAEANYGRRVTDPNDRVLIKIILKDFYNSNVLIDNISSQKALHPARR